jgi:hypothetical protein
MGIPSKILRAFYRKKRKGRHQAALAIELNYHQLKLVG